MLHFASGRIVLYLRQRFYHGLCNAICCLFSWKELKSTVDELQTLFWDSGPLHKQQTFFLLGQSRRQSIVHGKNCLQGSCREKGSRLLQYPKEASAFCYDYFVVFIYKKIFCSTRNSGYTNAGYKNSPSRNVKKFRLSSPYLNLVYISIKTRSPSRANAKKKFLTRERRGTERQKLEKTGANKRARLYSHQHTLFVLVIDSLVLYVFVVDRKKKQRKKNNNICDRDALPGHTSMLQRAMALETICSSSDTERNFLIRQVSGKQRRS